MKKITNKVDRYRTRSKIGKTSHSGKELTSNISQERKNFQVDQSGFFVWKPTNKRKKL